MAVNKILETKFYQAIHNPEYVKENNAYIQEQKNVWVINKSQKNPEATNIIYHRVSQDYERWKKTSTN
jgi:hypothetical protein